MKDEFDKLIDSAKNLGLGSAEKQLMKKALLSHIEKTSVRTEAEFRLNNIKREKSYLNIVLDSLSLRSIFIKNMAIVLIVILLVSGGASFAAENALPGDVLYPIKVGINEEVVAALTLNSEAKAHWNVRVAERRLEEAETLAAKGGLSADARAKIEANFDKHAERVSGRIAQFETEKNIKAAADIGSNFETSLRAHENILNKIAESKAGSEAEVKPILEKIKTKIKDSETGRSRVEAQVESRTNGEFKTAAEGKLTAAENKIAGVRRFIEENKDSVEAETTIKAEAELKLAEAAVTGGKAKIETQAYGEAFVLFQKALRIAQNAKIIMRAEKTFEIPIGIPARGESQTQFEIPIGAPSTGIHEIPIGIPADQNRSDGEIRKLPEESGGGAVRDTNTENGGGINIESETIFEIPIGVPSDKKFNEDNKSDDGSGGR